MISISPDVGSSARLLWISRAQKGFLFPGVEESSVLIDAGVLAGTLFSATGRSVPEMPSVKSPD